MGHLKGYFGKRDKILSSFAPLFKTRMNFFLLLNTKEDILKNMGKKHIKRNCVNYP